MTTVTNEVQVETVINEIAVGTVSNQVVVAGVPGTRGPTGPEGPPGASGTPGQSAYELWLSEGNYGSLWDFYSDISHYLGGQPVNIASLTEGDVLGYSGTAWVNQANSTLTDGGNF
jgi:hypothetical protein